MASGTGPPIANLLRFWACVLSAPEAEKRTAATGWPTLSIHLDQGSDGWAAASWMAWFAGICVVVFPDVSHRLWNDVQGALKASGLWGMTLMLQLVYNLDHGPWNSAEWLSKLKMGVQLYMKSTKLQDCPLFNMLLQDIVEDKNDPLLLADPHIAQVTFDSLPDVFEKLSDKVGMPSLCIGVKTQAHKAAARSETCTHTQAWNKAAARSETCTWSGRFAVHSKMFYLFASCDCFLDVNIRTHMCAWECLVDLRW